MKHGKREYHQTNARRPNNGMPSRRKPKERELTGTLVVVHNNDINKALKVLRRKMTEARLVEEMKERSAYIKPSDKKRRARNLSMVRARSRDARKSARESPYFRGMHAR